MREIILYSTHCPRCWVLERKLNDKGVSYNTVDSEEEILSMGIEEVPVLSVDGELMEFSKAVQWVNALEE